MIYNKDFSLLHSFYLIFEFIFIYLLYVLFVFKGEGNLRKRKTQGPKLIIFIIYCIDIMNMSQKNSSH